MTIRARYRPFAPRDPRGLLVGLMDVLRRRRVRVRWDRSRRRDHFMALAGGQGGVEIQVGLGQQRIPRLGRMIVMQAIYPELYSDRTAPWAVCFCDNANEVLYGAKFYVRKTPGDPSMLQIVAERACVVNDGGLFRLADEFDLLVTEYQMALEQLEGQTPEGLQLPLPYLEGMYDEPVAENC